MIHPSCLPDEQLLKDCKIRSLRRSGPGGQHRNKVETAIVIEHLPSGMKAEANERRCQKENRAAALFRLRLALAVNFRSQWAAEPETEGEQPESAAGTEISSLWRTRIQKGRISVASSHWDFPALLAEAMDHLCVQQWKVTAAAQRLEVSPSQLVKLLRMHPPSLIQVNRYRQENGLMPLR